MGTSHGTRVASLVAGDYTKGQGDGEALGDPDWTSGSHSSAWEWDATGTAPEASLILLGGSTGCADCYAAAYEKAHVLDADVLNISHRIDRADCDVTSARSTENELEVAYDNGVFVVVAAGNNDGPTATSCNVNAPGDTPKAFMVNGLDTESGTCKNDYHACPTHPKSSALGGADITIDGGTRKHAAIDVTAPADLMRQTMDASSNSPYGIVDEDYMSGTSISTPYVAGAALAVKESMLDEGRTWVNSPGRLQAMMLAMTDSWHDDSGTRSGSGLDDLSGTGRLKLRLFDLSSGYAVASPWKWSIRSFTFSSTGTTTYLPFSSPLSAGTEFFKCAVWEAEDMSGKSTMSDVYLEVDIREPVNGSCSSSGTAVASRTDWSFDIRHMVHIEDDDIGGNVELEGNCPVVKLHRAHTTSQGAALSTFCYAAGVPDDEF